MRARLSRQCAFSRCPFTSVRALCCCSVRLLLLCHAVAHPCNRGHYSLQRIRGDRPRTRKAAHLSNTGCSSRSRSHCRTRMHALEQCHRSYLPLTACAHPRSATSPGIPAGNDHHRGRSNTHEGSCDRVFSSIIISKRRCNELRDLHLIRNRRKLTIMRPQPHSRA